MPFFSRLTSSRPWMNAISLLKRDYFPAVLIGSVRVRTPSMDCHLRQRFGPNKSSDILSFNYCWEQQWPQISYRRKVIIKRYIDRKTLSLDKTPSHVRSFTYYLAIEIEKKLCSVDIHPSMEGISYKWMDGSMGLAATVGPGSSHRFVSSANNKSIYWAKQSILSKCCQHPLSKQDGSRMEIIIIPFTTNNQNSSSQHIQSSQCRHFLSNSFPSASDPHLLLPQLALALFNSIPGSSELRLSVSFIYPKVCKQQTPWETLNSASINYYSSG